ALDLSGLCQCCLCYIFFLFYRYAAPRHLHSFPTRRSSDLLVLVDVVPRLEPDGLRRIREFMQAHIDGFASLEEAAAAVARYLLRSEEHTSELQSRENLVCRLLLEKKKKTTRSISTRSHNYT